MQFDFIVPGGVDRYRIGTTSSKHETHLVWIREVFLERNRDSQESRFMSWDGDEIFKTDMYRGDCGMKIDVVEC